MMNLPFITDQITCVATTVPHGNFSHVASENQYKYYNTHSLKPFQHHTFMNQAREKKTKHKKNLIPAK